MDPLQPVFRLLSSARSARAFHPRGQMFTGLLHVEGHGPLPVGPLPALARLSKGAGTPGGLPDALGVAFRVTDEHDREVDILCTSTLGALGWAARTLAPRGSWTGAELSSLMGWRSAEAGSGERRAQVGLLVRRAGSGTVDPTRAAELLPVEADVVVTDGEHPIQRGTLRLDALTERSAAFDPMRNHPAGWELWPGWLARAREAAYVGSRRGRGARPD